MLIQWKTIYGYDHLLISTDGQVKSKARLCKRKDGGKGDTQFRNERIIYPANKDGYLWLNINIPNSCGRSRKFLSVHRLMIETFIRPLLSGEEVNHINGKRDDNHLENLEIVANKDEHSKKTWERLKQEWYDKGFQDGKKVALEELDLLEHGRPLPQIRQLSRN